MATQFVEGPPRVRGEGERRMEIAGGDAVTKSGG